MKLFGTVELGRPARAHVTAGRRASRRLGRGPGRRPGRPDGAQSATPVIRTPPGPRPRRSAERRPSPGWSGSPSCWTTPPVTPVFDLGSAQFLLDVRTVTRLDGSPPETTVARRAARLLADARRCRPGLDGHAEVRLAARPQARRHRRGGGAGVRRRPRLRRHHPPAAAGRRVQRPAGDLRDARGDPGRVQPGHPDRRASASSRCRTCPCQRRSRCRSSASPPACGSLCRRESTRSW